MKLPTILLAILFAHLSTVTAEPEGGNGLRRKLVKVVKRKRVDSDQEREGRSILGGTFPFIEEAKHTFHASQQRHHPQRISALQKTNDPTFLEKLREHERQREIIFGQQNERQNVPIRSVNIPSSQSQSYNEQGLSSNYQSQSYTDQGVSSNYHSQQAIQHQPTQVFSRSPASVVQTQYSVNTNEHYQGTPARDHPQRLRLKNKQRQNTGQQQRAHSHKQSNADALREHSAALRRHKEELEAAKRLIKFHEERYLKHNTGHIVPLPASQHHAPVYRPTPSPPIPNPIILNRRRQQIRKIRVQRPRPVIPISTPIPAYEPVVPQIQGYIEPAVQIQTHAEPHIQPQLHFAPVPQSVRSSSYEAEQISRQVAPSIDIAVLAQERCVDKVVYVEETVEDDAIECHHSYEKKCHTTYVTDFKSESEEECEENFTKDCFIEYKPVAMNETVEFCHTPIIKDCNIEGPVTCKTEYETDCRTKYHEHQVIDDIPNCKTVKEHSCREVVNGYKSEEKCQEWPVQRCSLKTELVTKTSPETKCEKIPKKICAPKGCGFVSGLPECFDKTETIIQDIPEETCNLQPQKHCKQVTKLVPNLEPTEECVDVPKEVCTKSTKNPRKIKKPITKKWCYTPSKESGLI
ncbi:uncharacterized protein [Lepeophtheirus salmonis]|uniref:uncharacterized protein n=1 Tax=Lepeophtheirus salmonis TaxID=72036 RepID=UPI001AE3DFC7|nr:uncharacterized protein LOC121124490 [Lepeophtheirus salmonis]